MKFSKLLKLFSFFLGFYSSVGQSALYNNTDLGDSDINATSGVFSVNTVILQGTCDLYVDNTHAINGIQGDTIPSSAGTMAIINLGFYTAAELMGRDTAMGDPVDFTLKFENCPSGDLYWSIFAPSYSWNSNITPTTGPNGGANGLLGVGVYTDEGGTQGTDSIINGTPVKITFSDSTSSATVPLVANYVLKEAHATGLVRGSESAMVGVYLDYSLNAGD